MRIKSTIYQYCYRALQRSIKGYPTPCTQTPSEPTCLSRQSKFKTNTSNNTNPPPKRLPAVTSCNDGRCRIRKFIVQIHCSLMPNHGILPTTSVIKGKSYKIFLALLAVWSVSSGSHPSLSIHWPNLSQINPS